MWPHAKTLMNTAPPRFPTYCAYYRHGNATYSIEVVDFYMQSYNIQDPNDAVQTSVLPNVPDIPTTASEGSDRDAFCSSLSRIPHTPDEKRRQTRSMTRKAKELERNSL